MPAEVALSTEALADLLSIYIYVAEAANVVIADRYDARIRQACFSLADFPGRGTPREDLAPGLRSVSFRRRVTIYYRVANEKVAIVRVLPKGADARRAFGGG